MCFCKSIGQGIASSQDHPARMQFWFPSGYKMGNQADDSSDDRIQEQEVARLFIGDDGNVRSAVIPFTGVLYPFV